MHSVRALFVVLLSTVVPLEGRALHPVEQSLRAEYTDPFLGANSTLIKRLHIVEMRDRLDQARAVIGVPPLVYTDPTITVGVTSIKAAHITELREGTQ